MQFRTKLRPLLSRLLKDHPRLKQAMKSTNRQVDLLRNTTAHLLPRVIQPDPEHMRIAVTANCNLRCMACRYGRDFMPGTQLPLASVRDLLDDARELNISGIHLYGGEPLLHKDIVPIVEHSVGRRLNTWLSTNGILLKGKIDDLYRAGLRSIVIGFYGIGEAYNSYVQRQGQFTRLEESIAYIRDRYGASVKLMLSWVLMRPTCSIDDVLKVWGFAECYAVPMFINLIEYSLPYFTEGPQQQLHFRPEDGPAIEQVVNELIRLKKLRPDLLYQSAFALRPIPDWLRLGPQMRVPCEAHKWIWVGADGTVQLCPVTFKLGNIHQSRLRDLLFTQAHRQAGRDAFNLRCPNCYCAYDTRIETHLPSLLKYSSISGTL